VAAELDVLDTARLREAVDRAFAELGHIDVVFSNAGAGAFGAAEELTDEAIDAQIALNMTAPIQLTRAVLPHLRAQGAAASSRPRPWVARSPALAAACTTRPSGASRASSTP
jgi:NAD(P)-dependent dehydrogenase (short-subunit alcohol dehydrogenase family)